MINKLKNIIRNNATVFKVLWTYREKEGFDRRVLRRGDDMLIEGYPRSANSFAYYTFLLSQNNPLKVGNHTHSPSQFALARKYKIPAMLVIRQPVDAVLSYILYDQNLSALTALERYVSFHKPLIANPTGFVVAPFDEVITDFGESMRRLNSHFNCSFVVFSHDEANVKKIYHHMAEIRKKRILLRNIKDEHLELMETLPSNEKETQKKARRSEVTDP